MKKFCRFTEWPKEKQLQSFDIVFLGKTNLPEFFQKIGGEAKIKNKNVNIMQVKSLEEITEEPYVIFVAKDQRRNIPEILEYAKSKNILLISDSDGFGEDGIHINFYLTQDETLHFTINLQSAKDANLRISLMLIEIAKVI